MQVMQYKKEIKVPTITRTPTDFEGAQFSFKELLFEVAELEV